MVIERLYARELPVVACRFVALLVLITTSIRSDSGIADSPIAYEYLGKFYISEGNKRVSVLKSYGAVFIPCVVKRVMPKDKDSFEGKLYYDFFLSTRLLLWGKTDQVFL